MIDFPPPLDRALLSLVFQEKKKTKKYQKFLQNANYFRPKTHLVQKPVHLPFFHFTILSIFPSNRALLSITDSRIMEDNNFRFSYHVSGSLCFQFHMQSCF